MKLVRNNLIYYILPFFLLFFSSQITAQATFDRHSESNVMDYTAYNFDGTDGVVLDNTWAFYWQKLLTPEQVRTNKNQPLYVFTPNSWSDPNFSDKEPFPIKGYATYHARIKLPPNIPKLAIASQYIGASCKIFIDDELIIQNGDVGTTAQSSSYHPMPIFHILDNVKDSFNLTIQVSNFVTNRAGIVYNFVLADAKVLEKEHNLKFFLGLSFWGGVFFLGVFLIGSYFTLSLGRGLIYLGLCFISFGYWKCSSGKKLFNLVFVNYNWEWSIRIEIFAIILTFFFLTSFVHTLYPKENSKLVLRMIQSAQLFFATWVIFAPLPEIFPMLIPHIYLILVALAYVLIVIIRASLNKRENTFFLGIAMVLVVFNVLIYVLMNFIYNMGDSSLFMILDIVLLGILLITVINQQFASLISLTKKTNIAAEAKSQFLSTISHEMRTPMNGILGMTELLGRTPLNKEQQNFVETLHTSGRSLITLIDDILDSTRIKEGKLKIKIQSFDIHILAQEITSIFKQVAENRPIEISLEIAKNVPKNVIGDPIRIKQILDNLLNNALKFTENGAIELLISSGNNTELKFEVRDTGIGIPEGQQKQIFAQFSQVDGALNRQRSGLGLGLAICQQLVFLMEGKIEVKSKENEGSVFSVYLPLILGEKENRNVTKSEQIGTLNKELKILVVEDNPINLKLLLAGLKRLGYNSDSVINGQLAVEATQKKQYDLIFMDIQMPIMDGLEATRLIKENDNQTSFISVLTANAFPEDRQAAFDAGADEYIVKPFKLNTIGKLVEQIEMRKAQMI